MLTKGELDDSVHYFVVLVKYRHRVIATQMLSTVDGVQRGKLAFPNLINMRDLDFDFQVRVSFLRFFTLFSDGLFLLRFTWRSTGCRPVASTSRTSSSITSRRRSPCSTSRRSRCSKNRYNISHKSTIEIAVKVEIT